MKLILYDIAGELAVLIDDFLHIIAGVLKTLIVEFWDSSMASMEVDDVQSKIAEAKVNTGQ